MYFAVTDVGIGNQCTIKIPQDIGCIGLTESTIEVKTAGTRKINTRYIDYHLVRITKIKIPARVLAKWSLPSKLKIARSVATPE
jgi:hypothetical protein